MSKAKKIRKIKPLKIAVKFEIGQLELETILTDYLEGMRDEDPLPGSQKMARMIIINRIRGGIGEYLSCPIQVDGGKYSMLATKFGRKLFPELYPETAPVEELTQDGASDA